MVRKRLFSDDEGEEKKEENVKVKENVKIPLQCPALKQITIQCTCLMETIKKKQLNPLKANSEIYEILFSSPYHSQLEKLSMTMEAEDYIIYEDGKDYLVVMEFDEEAKKKMALEC